MLRHRSNNLPNGRSLKSFQHLLHRIEHLNLALHTLIILKIALISILTTPKIRYGDGNRKNSNFTKVLVGGYLQ